MTTSLKQLCTYAAALNEKKEDTRNVTQTVIRTAIFLGGEKQHAVVPFVQQLLQHIFAERLQTVARALRQV